MGGGRCVIVGASHASAQVCASLRQEGWDGEILLVGDEPSLPYQRPPLSKTYLAGGTTLEGLLIRKPDFYDKQRVTFRQGLVTRIDRSDHAVVLDDGERIGYDKLVLCLGARPRRLKVPGADLSGVHYLRDARDLDGIRRDLPGVTRAVLVGAGYIGLETAASLRSLGVQVTVVEVADRVLQRVTAPAVSAFYDRVHREEGVDLRVGVGLESISGDGRVQEVLLSDGSTLKAELVIAGIGVEANTDLAAEAGLAVGNGVRVDAGCRTTDPDVFAAGDCAEYPDERYGRRLRLESVPSAVEQAKVAAASVCGASRSISALPWFWSDQYDLKLQIAGLNLGFDDVVLRGDPGVGRGFTCFYLAQGRVVAADCVNRPQDFVFSKRAIVAGLSPDRETLADPATPLAGLLTAAVPH